MERCLPGEEDEPEDERYHKLIPEEFQLRILADMINNLKYDVTIFPPSADPKSSEGFEEPDYVDSIRNNRAYKCMAARNIYFT